MRIFVIGSEGNIGSKLVPYLESCGHTVYCADQVQGWRDKYAVVNIMSSSDLMNSFLWFKPDVVYLLAAMVSRVTCETSPGITIDTNLSGLNNVIQACRIYGSRLIYFSTSEVYGNIGGVLSEDRECEPNNLYGLTKYMGEKLVQYFLNDAIIVRPFMLYDEDETRGDHRSAMIRFCYHLMLREKIVVHKNSWRSWLHISDGVKIMEKLLYVKGEHIVNIGSNELVSSEALASLICKKLGLSYGRYVTELPLPDRMTLIKHPDINKQFELTKIRLSVYVEKGIEMVLDKLYAGTKF